MKTCITCNIEKPLTEYHKALRNKTGYCGNCKECRKKSSANHYIKNREHRLFIGKQYAERTREERNKKRTNTHRKWVLNNKDKVISYAMKYEDKNKIKVSARKKIKYAIATKKIIALPCEICGDLKVNGHHDDYSKPLTVRWLCHIHHMEWHRLNGEGLNGKQLEV